MRRNPMERLRSAIRSEARIVNTTAAEQAGVAPEASGLAVVTAMNTAGTDVVFCGLTGIDYSGAFYT